MQKKMIITLLIMNVYFLKFDAFDKKTQVDNGLSQEQVNKINHKIAHLYQQANQMIATYKPKVVSGYALPNKQRSIGIIPQFYMWQDKKLYIEYNNLMMRINHLLAKINKQSPYLPL